VIYEIAERARDGKVHRSTFLSGVFMFKRTRISSGVLLALGGVLLAPGAAIAQETQRIEITGSAIKRVDAETALPVTVISREEISRSGVASTEQLLQSVSAISSSGGLATTQGAGNSIYGRASPSLRGLGDERTLVLVNGRRVAPFAGGGGAAVNVNTIPLSAIDRVEVLRDGASSIYGSDAVAGVINFILRKDFTGAELFGSYDQPTRKGGGESTRISVVGGLGDLSKDRWNITISASQEREKELKATDRSFAKTGNVFPFIVAGATGLGNIEGAIDPVSGEVGAFGTSPGSGFGNPLAATDSCGTISMFRNPGNTRRVPPGSPPGTRAQDTGLPYCAYDSSPDVRLVPERDAKTFSAAFTLRLTDAVELFGDVLFGKSVVTQRIQPSPVRRSFLQEDAFFEEQGVVPALILDPSNPNYATAADYLTTIRNAATTPAFVQAQIDSLIGQPLAITSRVFDFGLRTARDTSKQTRFVAGARGLLFGQDYEVAFSRNESKTSGTVIDGYFSQLEYVRAVNAPGSDWNPWSLTQSDAFNQRIAAAEFTGATLNAKSTSNVFDGKLTGEAFSLPAGMAQYAVGAQYREEKYVTSPSPALETGDIAGLGGAVPPVDRSRKIGALYAEFNAPIVKGLEGSVSARGDKYSAIGNSTTYKAAMRWQPTRDLLFRASTSSGFRAPTLTDLWTPQTSGTSEQFDDPISGLDDIQVSSLTGGNPNLKPEKSRQTSIGFVLQPAGGLSVGADLFWVSIKDIINSPSAQEVVSGFVAGNPTYADAVRLTPGGDIASITQVTVNSGTAKVRGVDLDVNYRFNLGSGKVDVNWFATYMDKFDETSPGGVVSSKVGTIINPDGSPVLGADTGGVVLRWKYTLSGTYSVGPWAFTLGQNYSHHYDAGLRALDDAPNRMGALATYDLNVSYSGIKNLRLSAGVKNLTDRNPPGVFTPASNQFQAGYDVTQYDARARRVYVSAGYKFF
jgi:iron complex outermembrane recepter protein